MRLHGVCAPNSETFPDSTWERVRLSKVQSLKLMGHTSAAEVPRAIQNGVSHFMVRLYTGSPGHRGGMPSPAEWVRQVCGTVEEPGQLRAFYKAGVRLFEIHNEPNHEVDGRQLEGFGSSYQDARDFAEWFKKVYRALKAEFPDCQFGFPGMAVPHNDLEWLEWARDAIELADWLGCHPYWQTASAHPTTYRDDYWGGRYKLYHAAHPGKDIWITEYGNSNGQGAGLGTNPEQYAQQYRYWLDHVAQFSYVKGVYGFILDSPDPQWGSFVWHEVICREVAKVRMGTMPAPKPAETPALSLANWLKQKGAEVATVPVTPNFALYRAIWGDGFIPNGPEETFSFEGVAYRVRSGEHPTSGEKRVYYARVPGGGQPWKVQWLKR